MSTTDVATSRARGVLVVTCLSTLVVNANTSAVSILLPAISDDTGMSVTDVAVGRHRLLAGGCRDHRDSGSLGDVFGRKRIFQLGLLLFVASCVLIALSTSGGAVIAGRCIQGASGATILACGLSLLTVGHAREGQAAGRSRSGARRQASVRRRATARWCLGRGDGLAGAVLDRRGRRLWRAWR
jgi:MFS family permease